MSKKIFVLFLSIFVMLFACSSAMADVKTVSGIQADGGTYNIEYDFNTGDAFVTEDDETGIVGHNLNIKYTVPTLYLDTNVEFEASTVEAGGNLTISQDNLEFTWSLDLSAYPNLTATFSDDVLVITGLFPETSGDITIKPVATLSNIINISDVVIDSEQDSNVNALLRAQLIKYASGITYSEDITFTVDKESSTLVKSSDTSFDLYVSVDKKVDDINKVTSDYAVSVAVPSKTVLASLIYTSYIVSDDTDVIPELPYWLYIKDTKTDTVDEETHIVSLDIAFKSGEKVTDGTKGRVFIPIYDVENSETFLLCWDVTYKTAEEKEKEEEKDRPFGISGDKEVNFSFTKAGTSQSQTLTYTGSVSVVSYDLSGDLTAFTTEITSTDISTDTYTGTITVKITTPSIITTPRADYTGSIIFRDADGASADVAVKIAIDITGASFAITPSTKSFPLAPGESKDVTITANSAVPSSSWKVTSKSDDISVDITVSDDYIAVATVTAHEDAAEGKNSVTITATDISGNSKTATLTVIVSSSSESKDVDFSITADRTTLKLAPDSTDTVIVTAVNGVVVSWDVSADEGITCEIITSSDEDAEIDLTVDEDAEDGNYTATVTAMDKDGNTDTATITVTVSSSDSGETTDTITLTPERTSVDIPVGETRSIGIRASNFSGASSDISWDYSPATSYFSVNVKSNGSSAVADITASAVGSGTATITATDSEGNKGSVSITVTVSSSDSGETTETITLTSERTSVSMPVGETRSIGITASNFSGASSDISWEHSPATSYFSVNVRSNGSSAVADITASAVGSGTATITATDAEGNADSVSITVTVISGDSGSGGSDVPINKTVYQSYQAPSQTALTNIKSNEATFISAITLLLPDSLRSLASNLTGINAYNDSARKAAATISDDVLANLIPKSNDQQYIVMDTWQFSADGFNILNRLNETCLTAGANIYIHLLVPDGYNPSMFKVAAEQEAGYAVLTDESATKTITTVPANKYVQVLAFTKANTPYTPVAVTAAVSGDVSGDRLRAANVGCNAGFGSLLGMLTAMFTASALYLRKKDN